MGYHFHIDFVSRGKGQSLVAKGAYQARTKFREERTGEYKDYTHKPDRPVKSFVFVDKKHGAELQNVETLLNAIDRAETQANSQTGLNFTAALPKELSDEDRARMVRDFGREHFLRKGIPAIAHIHPPHEHAPTPQQTHEKDEHEADELHNGNWHVHIIAGTRTLGPDGQFGEKYITWDNYREFLEHKRERWAELGARYLEKAGHKVEAERWRYGHLTNPEQREKALERGDHEWAEKKAKQAGKHRGPNTDAMERKGIETDLGNASREIQQQNEDRAQLRALKRDLARLERQDAFDKLKHELTVAENVLAQTPQPDRAKARDERHTHTAKYEDIDRMLAAELLRIAESDPARFEKNWQTARNIPGLVAALESLKAEQQQQENENRKRELKDIDGFLAAELYKHQNKYPNHFRTHRQGQIPPTIAAEIEKLTAADAERNYEQRDPAKEQIAWEDALAKTAIEKERQERQFVEPMTRTAPQQDRQQPPARPRSGDQLIIRVAETAMRDPRQQHGESVNPAAFKDALEKSCLGLASVTPEEAAKSHREGKFAKELGRYAPVYQPGEIVILREPRSDGSMGGRVHKLDQTKAEDYLRCLALDKSQLQGVEATKQTLDERAQNRRRMMDAAKMRKARGPRRGGLAGQQIWASQRVRDTDRQRRQQPQPYRPEEYAEKQKRNSGEIDAERYRSDPDYRREAQNTQGYKSSEERKRDRENAVRAIMEQQDRGR
jgi:MobA/MobL family